LKPQDIDQRSSLPAVDPALMMGGAALKRGRRGRAADRSRRETEDRRIDGRPLTMGLLVRTIGRSGYRNVLCGI